MSLFDGEPSPSGRKARKAPQSDGTVTRLRAAFTDAFRRKWNPCAVHMQPNCRRCGDDWLLPAGHREILPVNMTPARDNKHLKDLAAGAGGEADVLELIRLFFASTDPKITGSDYRIADLYIHAQRLRLSQVRNAPGRNQRTDENIDAVARATRPAISDNRRR